VYSTTNSNPVYPDDKVVFIGERLQLSNSFKLDASKNDHYVRLCAVVLNDDYSKDRYCGSTKHLVTTADDFENVEVKKEYNKTEAVKKEDVKKTEIKKDVKAEVKEETKVKTETKVKETSTLSVNLKARIDVLLENFIERLEERGDSDEKIASTIELVIERLEKLSGNATYNKIVAYMMTRLNELKEEYSNSLSEIE
jgi:D-alanyl-D-alanine carboxypeptidase